MRALTVLLTELLPIKVDFKRSICRVLMVRCFLLSEVQVPAIDYVTYFIRSE